MPKNKKKIAPTKRYEQNAVLRAKIQATGVGLIADQLLVALAHHWDALQRQRFEAFIEDISAEGRDVREEEFHDEEFCHAAIITIDAVMRTRDRDKIRRFALLFTNYETVVAHDGKDVYEEFLRILRDLSAFELQVLLKLDDLQARVSDEEFARAFAAGENTLSLYWPDFVKWLETKNVTYEDLQGILERLMRTGFLRNVPIMGPNKFCRIMPAFKRFRHAIERHTAGKHRLGANT